MTSFNLDINLVNFFIFNSTYGPSEGEELEKILYYYPSTTDSDVQIRSVGLTEAIIQFTSSFKPNEPVSSLHTQKQRQQFFQPEDNFWMVITLTLPFVSKNNDGSEYFEYQEDDVQDNIFHAVLQQSYRMFCLFNGMLSSIVATTNADILKTKLELFFTPYLQSLKLQHCDLLNVFNGIQFLPLDKQNFLNTQCFINALEANYTYIKHTAFLYNEHLIWSGIEPHDMQTVYSYLVGTLLPEHMATELQGGSMPRHSTGPFSVTPHFHGRFITGPDNLKQAKSVEKVHKIYVKDDKKLSCFHLLVYRALSASICLFIDGDMELTVEIFKDLQEFIGPHLTPIVSSIAEYCSQQVATPSSVSDSSPKFIYFNKLNLAYKSTVHLDNKQFGNITCTPESLKIMADINKNKSVFEHAGETIVKTMNDFWVIGKVSNSREFYVAIQQKNASLIDISEEFKKLCDTELKGIFFHPC